MLDGFHPIHFINVVLACPNYPIKCTYTGRKTRTHTHTASQYSSQRSSALQNTSLSRTRNQLKYSVSAWNAALQSN